MLNRKAEKDKSRGFDFDRLWAFNYAQSIVGCEEAEAIWNKYR
jgi:hypothetical protein